MNLSDVTFCVYDLETTGLDPEKDRIVEIAGALKRFGPGGLSGIGFFQTLVDPGMEIPVASMAIHHIRQADVALAPTWDDARVMVGDIVTPETTVFVAHNGSRFDDLFVKAKLPFSAAYGFLDTKRLAQHLFPDAPLFSNQGLRYYFDLDVDTMGGSPHRALADVIVTSALLDKLLAEYLRLGYAPTVEDLLALSAAPIDVKVWPMGKHRGLPLNHDRSYADWMLRQSDVDPDLAYSLRKVLGQ